MARRFRMINYEKWLDQTLTIRDVLPSDHLARFIVQVILWLDVSAIYAKYAPVGGEAYAPELLLGLLFYGYATGVFSSRKIERATYESVPFRFLAGGWHPDHDTIANFRKTFLPEIADLFTQVLVVAHELGVLKLGNISVDGSKVQADASKSHAVSYGRLLQLEQRLQAVCDQLGPEQIQAFFAKWVECLPMPLTAVDRQAGYGHRFSVWQVEISQTQVFDDPVRGREFFEAVIRENLDLGRPDRVQLVFDRKIISTTPGRFRTRVIENGVDPNLYIEYKRSLVKQYFEEGRALRTETIINDPKDFRVRMDLSNLPFLQQIGREVNRRLLDVQRISHNYHLSQESLERLVQSTVTSDGQRAPGLRFGPARAMALLAALSLFAHNAFGFRHRDLRSQVADLLGTDYLAHQLSYNLRRLRLKGIIWRIPNTHHYLITPYGYKAALFFTRLNARVFQPGFAVMDPAVAIPSPLAEALTGVEQEIGSLLNDTHLAPART
jgi:transposase